MIDFLEELVKVLTALIAIKMLWIPFGLLISISMAFVRSVSGGLFVNGLEAILKWSVTIALMSTLVGLSEVFDTWYERVVVGIILSLFNFRFQVANEYHVNHEKGVWRNTNNEEIERIKARLDDFNMVSMSISSFVLIILIAFRIYLEFTPIITLVDSYKSLYDWKYTIWIAILLVFIVAINVMVTSSKYLKKLDNAS
jgi:hypothetical protein